MTTSFRDNHRLQRGHSLAELMAALVASGFLLAGLGSVMLIARQVAYAPTAASRRTDAAKIVSQLTDELQHATFIIGQSPTLLEFVVADRNADGTAETYRYEWSGTSGDPLKKSVNSGTPVTVLENVANFNATYLVNAKTTAVTTTTETAEAVLATNVPSGSNVDRNISTTSYSAHHVYPWTFSSIPSNATGWNATKIEFQTKKSGSATTLLVQLRADGEYYQGPSGDIFGQIGIPETSLPSGMSAYVATFASPIRGLSLSRPYALVWAGVGGTAAQLRVVDNVTPSGALDSNDAGASWSLMTTRQMYGKVYGTYNTPGTTYNVTRNYITHVRIVLQASTETYARIDASVPMTNAPEQLSAYWRTEFDPSPAPVPTAINYNGDGVADWVQTGGGTFDPATLIAGSWFPTAALETRPLSDFTLTTTIEARCRNTSVGGNGAVIRINADRQGGQYAPLLVYVQKLSDGTQTLTLNGKTSDSAFKQLFSRTRLSTDFVRVKLTILPQNNVVNLMINDEDQGSYVYPTYAPSSTTDRYATFYGDTSIAEFDYVDVRVGSN